MNTDNYNAVLAHIEQHPEEWNQLSWCGTACCLAGHANKMFPPPNPNVGIIDGAHRALGFTDDQSWWLFHGSRTLDDFRRVRLVAGYANFARPR